MNIEKPVFSERGIGGRLTEKWQHCPIMDEKERRLFAINVEVEIR